MKLLPIAFGLLAAALLGGRASATETDYAAGESALPLQQAGGSARAMAMGSAVVAVSQGSASLLWNPAGLSRMTCTEVGLHHNTGLGDTIQEVGIFGVPLGTVKDDGRGGSLGGLAVSIGYVNYGGFDGRDIAGLPTSSYHATEYSGSLGWGIELLPHFAGGIVLKGDHSRLADQGYNSAAADLGVLWNAASGLDLGLTYSNISLGTDITGTPLTSGWRLGAGWTIDRRWLLAVSGELQKRGVDRLQLGTEYLVGDVGEKENVLALRAGYQLNYPSPELNGLRGLTFGLGYTITHSIGLDYAFLPIGDLGVSHRLSLTFRFNCPEKPLPPPVAAAAAEPVVAPVERPPVVLKAILLEDSHFDFDKSTLRPGGMEALRDNLRLLKENPKAKVRVAGYTSMMGTAEYNQALSERRAAAVEEFLIKEGINPSRISTIGFGSTRPATFEAKPADSNSAAAKSNMRVLFEVTVK